MKQRMVNTKFWSDPWVMTKLNSLDRLLFLYLITNELTNISGIYEISEHRIAFDTGIEKDTLLKAMIPRLAPKVYYKDNWVILTNFTKHQNLKSNDVILGIKREFALAPIHIQTLALEGGWGEGLGMMPDTKPNLTKLNLLGELEIRTEIVNEKPTREKKDTTYLKVFELWKPYPLNWRKNTTQIDAAKNLLEEHGLEDVTEALDYYHKNTQQSYIPEILTPSDLDRKWLKLAAFSLKKYGK